MFPLVELAGDLIEGSQVKVKTEMWVKS